MSIKPSQKFGVATPSRAATIPTLSIALYCLVALMIPIGSAMATATRIDQPVIVQYGKYMLNLLHGDMGKSYKTKRDVFPTIMAAFPNTAKLAIW